jgi:hypothetical protein
MHTLKLLIDIDLSVRADIHCDGIDCDMWLTGDNGEPELKDGKKQCWYAHALETCGEEMIELQDDITLRYPAVHLTANEGWDGQIQVLQDQIKPAEIHNSAFGDVTVRWSNVDDDCWLSRDRARAKALSVLVACDLLDEIEEEVTKLKPIHGR